MPDPTDAEREARERAWEALTVCLEHGDEWCVDCEPNVLVGNLALDAYAAAVRAAERDRCIAVVEKAQRYEGETRFGLSGHTMERNEWGDWLDRDSTLAALRGTEEAPDDPH